MVCLDLKLGGIERSPNDVEPVSGRLLGQPMLDNSKNQTISSIMMSLLARILLEAIDGSNEFIYSTSI